jgi:hypothetical protein
VLAALGEPLDPALDAALGPRRAAELRGRVAGRAAAWALASARGGPALVSSRVAGGALAGTVPFAEPAPAEVAEALGAALAGHDGFVLLVAPDVPRLDAGLAADAVGDLAAGCSVSFAPATDGHAFLLALARADAGHLALLGTHDRRRDEVVGAALALGGEIGMLRSERRLVTPADAWALALDPLVPAELRSLARGG